MAHFAGGSNKNLGYAVTLASLPCMRSDAVFLSPKRTWNLDRGGTRPLGKKKLPQAEIGGATTRSRPKEGLDKRDMDFFFDLSSVLELFFA